MRKIKKLMSAVVSLMMICTSMGGFTLWSSADDENVTLNLTSVKSLSLSTNDNGETTYTLNGKTVVYTGQIILKGTLENGFTIENGEHNIGFNGVTINNSVVIKPNAIANIVVKEKTENTITAKTKSRKNSFLWIDDTVGQAGINVPEGATLNLSGTGTLTATGSDDDEGCSDSTWGDGGAGIGGNDEENAGKINIKDVTVTATGGRCAAGIGGGEKSNGGSINISGGTVTATGGDGGAGIGGGDCGNNGNIDISGGKIDATGGHGGAGIGGGAYGNGGNITIEGGEVTATGDFYAAGIGGGDFGYGGNINISGGTVTATGGVYGAGIGSGDGCECDRDGGNINISGGTVNTKGGLKGAGIGGGYNGNGGNINISGGTVDATGGALGAGIGGGHDGDSGNIIIKNAVVTTTGGDGGAGIGGGNGYYYFNSFYNADGECKNITIDNSTVVAKAGKEAEAIGGGADEKYTGTVKIGNITLTEAIRETYYNWNSAIRVNNDNTIDKNNVEKPVIEKRTDITLKPEEKLTFSINENLRKTYTYNGETKVYNKVKLTGKLENGFTVKYNSKIMKNAVAADIILDGVEFNDSIVIESGVTANIDVEGTNTVTAKVNKGFDDTGKAGINVPEGATLNLSGNGKLTAKGSDDGSNILGADGGAGIGGNNNETAGTININVKEIIAIGGKDAAGIGGGEDGNSGTINITGGTVKATGGRHGAGIGGGTGNKSSKGECEKITIKNATVTATAGIYAEPIGGGADERYSGKVIINGNELNEKTRKQYYNYGSIKVNPEGKVEQYTEK